MIGIRLCTLREDWGRVPAGAEVRVQEDILWVTERAAERYRARGWDMRLIRVVKADGRADDR